MRFGGIVALDAVSFSVDKGRIVGLIGPNGAGKTTLFNCLSRLYRQVRGDIRLNGQSLRRCAPSDIAALGVGRTFQAPTLFASMSVLDNVKVGSHARGRNGPLTDALTLPSTRSEEHKFDETAREMLGFRRSRKTDTPAGREPVAWARESAWNWRGRSPPGRCCCCSMNQPADLITRKSPSLAR